MAACYAFDRFVLDPRDRRLRDDGTPVEVNARYLDALALLVQSHGQLVSKDQFMAEVWQGIPVTDEALTQCIKTLRRLLGDNVGNPRFIQTVPKHGYRFIAPVTEVNQPAKSPAGEARPKFAMTVLGGVIGGGLAGIMGGLLLGLVVTSGAPQSSNGAFSVLLVLICVTSLVALVGSAGVSVGIATAGLAKPNSLAWSIFGGAAGGFFVGAFGKLVGLDAFNLLVGQSPGNITGGPEGLVLGAAIGLAAWVASRSASVKRALIAAAACGGCAGVGISLLGGRLLIGSLDLLQRQMTSSRLRLDQIGTLFGERTFGPITLATTAAIEGALFAAAVVAAMKIAAHRAARA